LVAPRDPVSRRIIHTGFIVHDRTAEDHFYKDILGFHLYWYGGMKPDRTDWVAMQVPDGTDWLEYMLNQPMNPDLRLTGVMNHISLGVKDMKAAQAKLESRGWKPHGDEHSQMGKQPRTSPGLDRRAACPTSLESSVSRAICLQTTFRSFHFSETAAFLFQQVIFDSADALGCRENLFPFGIAFTEQDLVALRRIG